MYLANIKLWNFRMFGSAEDMNLEKPNLDLNFSQGLNVFIGENDSGKSAIVDAIKLVLRTHSYEWIRVVIEDFYTDNDGVSDRFRIELCFEGLSDEEGKNFTEWIGWKGEGEEATPYLRLIYDVRRQNSRILPTEVRAGVDEAGYQLSAEARYYLRCVYLKPLRDAQSELVPKKNSRLSQILQSHEAFENKDDEHHLVDLFNFFNRSVEKYFEAKKIVGDNEEDIDDKLGQELKKEIDGYIKSFYDETKETEIRIIEGRLKNILEKLELSIKDGFNLGLGTLNRLFMASELLHLNKTNWTGIRLGLIEELEAHLHPQAQMQVVESLQKKQRIQLILTTHSPNLASKVELSNLVLCTNSGAYPMGDSNTKLDPDDYVFLEKFLDVTKSNLFFAKGVILVEGWAEEIFLPALAEVLKSKGIISKNLTESGVSIVNVGSTAFLRYAKIFLRQKNDEKIGVPISILTDVDVREYQVVTSRTGDNRIHVDDKGNAISLYQPIDEQQVKEQVESKMKSLRDELDNGPVSSFIAPNWTFEYTLWKSPSFSSTFKQTARKVHPKMSDENFETDLARKLILKTLKKTEIAYLLSQAIESDLSKPAAESELNIGQNDPVEYLINAIKHACGD